MNGPKRCDCACHEHGARVFHAFPCCDEPIQADSLGTRESRFPAVPGSSLAPEKNAPAIEGELQPAPIIAGEDLEAGQAVTVATTPGGRRVACVASLLREPVHVVVKPWKSGDPPPPLPPSAHLRPFAELEREEVPGGSVLAPLFADFARIFGGPSK